MTDPTRTTVTPPSRYGAQWRTALAAAPRRGPMDLMEVSPGDTVVVIGAHPDDETFGVGATLAQLAADRVAVHVVVLTAGEAALDHVGVQVAGLAERRGEEFACACRALGVDSGVILDFPDAGLADTEDAALDAVRLALAHHRPKHVLTVWWDDPHADHQVSGRVARRAAAEIGCDVSGFPIWALHWSDPQDALSRKMSVHLMNTSDAARAARTAAVDCYRSQTEPLSNELEAILPVELTAFDLEPLVRA